MRPKTMPRFIYTDNEHMGKESRDIAYRQTSHIRRTKSENLNVSRLV